MCVTKKALSDSCVPTGPIDAAILADAFADTKEFLNQSGSVKHFDVLLARAETEASSGRFAASVEYSESNEGSAELDSRRQDMAKKKKHGHERLRPTPLRSSFADHEMAAFAELDDGKLSEADAMELVLQYHPELKRLSAAGQLPELMTDAKGNEWNPRMHLLLHVVIERQLANDTPSGIVAVAQRLEQEKKLNQHDVKHVLAAAVAEQLWYMQTELCPFDEARYFQDIERLYKDWVREIG